MLVTRRFNDLLGVTVAQHHGTGPVKYVLFHPGNEIDELHRGSSTPTALFIEQQKPR
jgi:hypothetical protein